MKLELLNNIDRDTVSNVWRISRGHLSEEESIREDILSMGLPVSSFERYRIKIESSILLRDLLFTVRPITAWAQSLRIVKFDKDNLTIDPFHEQDEANELIKKCIDRVDNGEIQDYVKESLPWSTLTTYVIELDFRTFINLVYTFEVNGFKDYFDEFYKFFIECTGLTDLQYNTFKKSDLYPYVSFDMDKDLELLNNYMDGSIKSFGTLNAIGGIVKPNLMAQFIRQHNHVVKNSLWNYVKEVGIDKVHKLALDSIETSDIYVLAYLDEMSLSNLVSTRTCWFAQFDKVGNSSWSKLFEPIVSNMSSSEFINQLPCRGSCKNCVIKGDMNPKIEHKDRNLPCPILLKDPSFIKLRYDKYTKDTGSASVVMNSWMQLYDEGRIKYDAYGSEGTQIYNDRKYFDNVNNSTNDEPRYLKKEVWTSELIIHSDIDLSKNIEASIDNILNNISHNYSKFDKDSLLNLDRLDLDLLIRNSIKFQSNKDALGLIGNYDISNSKYDFTCMLKGLALKLIHELLYDSGSNSHLINFGGDILGYNTSASIRLSNSNFYINKSGNFCVMTSGNTEKRGNHIKMESNDLEFGTTGTLIINDINDPVYYDALSTMLYSDSSMEIHANNLGGYILIDGNGKLIGNTYCASPFFNNEEVYIRDKMLLKINNVFRPDQTFNSNAYNKSPSRDTAERVYIDNIDGIRDSQYLVFPEGTRDLGTLFEVGYALSIDKPIVRYSIEDDTYTFIDTDVVRDYLDELFCDIDRKNYKYNNDIIIDCSDIRGAILVGYFNDSIKKYTLGNGMDNIMLAINHYRHEKDILGNYVLTPNKFMVGM